MPTTEAAMINADRDVVLLADAGPHEIDDCDVVAGLTPSSEAVAEHETQRGFEHRS
jgi:hypothetical protein